MLEQFHVPSDEEVRIDPEAMRQTVHEIFVSLGRSLNQECWHLTQTIVIAFNYKDA